MIINKRRFSIRATLVIASNLAAAPSLTTLTGPRQLGKTTLVSEVFKDYFERVTQFFIDAKRFPAFRVV